MDRIFGILKKDATSIHHAAFWLAFFAVVSGLLGLFRDRMLASFFGASRTLDVYYSAFRVPDFVYTLMLFLTSATAIIPIFLRKVETGKSETENFLGTLVYFFSLVVVVLSVASFFLMPKISNFLFPGFSIEEKSLSSSLSRIMLLSPMFLGLSNIFSSITQSFKRFFAYALSPVFYNLGIIFGILFLFPVFGIQGLSYGVVFGAFLHMAIQLPSLFGIGARFSFKKVLFSEIKNVVLYSVPRTLGLSINQFLLLIFTAVASLLSEGSIAVFNLSQNLGYLPTTVIGLSYGVAAFPSLASFSLKKDKLAFEEHFSSAFRYVVFWAVPISVLILILRAQIVRVILGSGAFSWADTKLTAASLFLFSMAIAFQSLFLLLVRAFYAEGEVKKTILVNILSATLSIGFMFLFLKILAPGQNLTFLFSRLLDISDISDIRVLALPVGILLGTVLNLLLLFWVFKKTFGWFPLKKSKKSIFEIIFASLIGAVVAYFGLNIFSLIFNLQTFVGIFFQGFLSGILGILGICATLRLFKNKEFFEIVRSLKTIIWRDHVPAPEPEKLP